MGANKILIADDNQPNAELLEAYLADFDCELAFAEGAGPDQRNYRVNCEKALRVLHGFRPQWTAREGAKELHEAHVTHGLTLEDFEGPKFQRIAHIRHLLAEGILDETLRHTTKARSAP